MGKVLFRVNNKQQTPIEVSLQFCMLSFLSDTPFCKVFKKTWSETHVTPANNVQSCRLPDLTSNYHKHDDSETFSVLELLGHTKRRDVFFIIQITQPAFTCSKLKIETLEQDVKYVHQS